MNYHAAQHEEPTSSNLLETTKPTTKKVMPLYGKAISLGGFTYDLNLILVLLSEINQGF